MVTIFLLHEKPPRRRDSDFMSRRKKSPGDYYQEKSSHRTHPPRENTYDLASKGFCLAPVSSVFVLSELCRFLEILQKMGKIVQ
jgi:hypothetical protein